MNIQIIKQLTDRYSMDELKQAENDLLEGNELKIAIEGQDEGEQLTHILAAIFCKHEMEHAGMDINQAVRAYSKRVRNSIN